MTNPFEQLKRELDNQRDRATAEKRNQEMDRNRARKAWIDAIHSFDTVVMRVLANLGRSLFPKEQVARINEGRNEFIYEMGTIWRIGNVRVEIDCGATTPQEQCVIIKRWYDFPESDWYYKVSCKLTEDALVSGIQDAMLERNGSKTGVPPSPDW